jgi:nucleoid-associated protein YgaU
MGFKFPSISGFGPLDKIVNDFTKSLNDIFGLGETAENSKMRLVKQLVLPEGTLHSDHRTFDPELWTGNTNRSGEKRLRYGFRIIDIKDFNADLPWGRDSKSAQSTYYLDIPPQAISQKELFATNISATRRGVVVESEGVVFKDIVISGTTGVFPGPRDGYGGPQANLKKLTEAPKQAGGVANDGTSKASPVISGYAEFLGLRAFFLKYSQSKIQAKGEKFLVFINEKDQQSLVVEPLEFTMERSSKNPLQYQYRIVLKCITTLDAVLQSKAQKDEAAPSLLQNIVNVSRNAVAAITQFRAAVGATNRLVQGISQEIDKTFIQPLRLLGAAFNDVAEARSNILAVPTVLSRNLNNALLLIQENRFTASKNQMANALIAAGVLGGVAAFSSKASPNNSVFSGKISDRGSTDVTTSKSLLDKARAQAFVDSAIDSLESSAFEPLSRSFVQNLRDEAQRLADNIADVLNLGDTSYDEIKHRTNTNPANPLKVATPNEYLLLGATLRMIDALNAALATNALYFTVPEHDFARDEELLNHIAVIQVPQSVKTIIIQQNDTLEKISLREYGTVARWVEIARLNKLKYPYISDTASDGVKAYGDKLLVGRS